MKIFNTLADLQAARFASTGQLVQVKGTDTTGDGGIDFFLIQNSGTPDGVDVFATAGGKIAVRQKGAKASLLAGRAKFKDTTQFATGTTTEGVVANDATWLSLVGTTITVETQGFHSGSTVGNATYKFLNAVDSAAAGYVDGISRFQIRSLDVYACLVVEGNVWASRFGCVSDGTVQDVPIQAAINFAETLVVNVSGKDQRGGVDVIVEGRPVIDELRITKSNIGLCGIGGTTFLTNRTTSGNPEPSIIVGTAETWQTTDNVSDTIKYNKLCNFRFSRDSGSSRVAILLSGVRNSTIENVNVETHAVGLYLENCSELSTNAFSAIGCTYSIIGDNRKNRIAANSPLGVACGDNDVSACTFKQTTSYYAQNTSVMLANTGTMNFIGGTVGIFSDNPLGSAIFGFPLVTAGFHYWGSQSSFTRGGQISGFVFEADQSETRHCIRITSDSKNNPVRGVSINACHVQTYAADYTSGNVTNLLTVESNSDGVIDGIKVCDSGFRFQDTGYQYPRMMQNLGTNQTVGVVFDNCYPMDSFSTSSVGNSVLRDIVLIESVDMESKEVDGVTPSGWTEGNGTASTLTANGGSSGVEASLLFDNSTAIIHIGKTFTYRNILSKLGAVYVSFWYKGDVAPYLEFLVNGQGDTSSATKSGTNTTRYGTAINDLPQSTNWRRATYLFKTFSATTPFDAMRVRIGRPAGGLSDFVEVKGIEVGYTNVTYSKYNVFE